MDASGVVEVIELGAGDGMHPSWVVGTAERTRCAGTLCWAAWVHACMAGCACSERSREDVRRAALPPPFMEGTGATPVVCCGVELGRVPRITRAWMHPGPGGRHRPPACMTLRLRAHAWELRARRRA